MASSSFFVEACRNQTLQSTLTAWVVAQSLKVLGGVFRERRFNFKWFVGTGGMPSSHSSSAAALATSVGLRTGFTSPDFGIAFVFALVVMFDAQSVRRTIGRQAEILNKIGEDIYAQRGIQEERLRELVGHSPTEVLAGALIGIFVALAFGMA